ncbi:MAG: MMPL family transporter [Propionibacteriaceae bacterium]|jgi:RND superfamily putative drug exporter|nr:MMPL family transporter [Propionibacteriaceae bacterium]
MATLLYRLGTWSARHAWSVVLAWLLILGGAVATGTTLMRPFTTSITVPGAEFQEVVDDLQEALPEAAGGSSSVVFSTTDGAPFTPAQEAAIKGLLADWEAIAQVDSVIDPFESQRELDDAASKIVDGRTELADGKREIEENAVKLADGLQKLADGREELETNAAKLIDGEQELNKGQDELNAGRKELNTNAAKLTDGLKKLKEAQQKLDAGKAELEAGAAQIEAGLAQVEAQETGLAAGQQQLDQARAELTAGSQQVQAGLAQLKNGITQLKAQIAALTDQYGADSAEVAQVREQLSGLKAQREELKGQAAQLEAGAAQLDAQQAQLDAGAQQLAGARAELEQAKAQIDAGRAELAAGQAAIDANLKKLTSGQAQLNAGRKELNRGQATIDANRKKINDGKRQIADGRIELADAEDELADGERKLAEGRQELIDGEADLVRGERQLALTTGLRMISESGQVAVSRVSFTTGNEGVTEETKAAIIAAGDALASAGIVVDYGKEISASSFVFSSEVLGLLVAAVVLLVMLGSLLAAGLPLLTALIGVGVGLMGVLAATHWTELTEFTPILALMLGLAVGIDYALFLVNRHRHHFSKGTELIESIGLATGTAGNAVVVAGTTVAVAVGALTLTGMPFLGWLGMAAAVTICCAVLVSITLTPALLRFLGPRILPKKRRLAIGQPTPAAKPPVTKKPAAVQVPAQPRGWGAFVTRHPVAVMLSAAAVLAIIAIPAANMRLWLPDGSAEPPDSTAYRSYTLIADHFGAGQNATMIAVAEVPANQARQLTDDTAADLELAIAEQLSQTAGISYVVPAMRSDDNQTLVFQLVPTTGPSDEATVELVTTLRANRSAIIASTGIAALGYAGQTVADIDISDQLASALPTYLAVVVGISLILLLLVFRSLLVPLLATAGFLLSILASFGAAVAVYQWGWLGPLLGVHQPSPILSFLPTLAIGITFGLAMDYQMFLVTGMREAWAHGEDARGAVLSGFKHGAKVITAAALIMTSVFASFIYSHMTVVRPVGFTLAIGVLIDAFVVRMTIMPAIMHLLGKKAWYLPGWLDRILPNLDVEGAGLAFKRSRQQ